MEIFYQIVLHIQRILQVGEDLLQDLRFAESVYTQKISPGFAQQEIAGHKIKADTQGQGSFQMLYIFFQMFGQRHERDLPCVVS